MTKRDCDCKNTETLIRRYFVSVLDSPEESTESDVAKLSALCSEISIALERGETPESRDIHQAQSDVGKIQQCLDDVAFLFRLDADAAHTHETIDTGLLVDEDLVALRAALEDGLSQAQNRGAEQEDVAQLLELYAGYVRDGYICPPSQRGNW